MRDDVRQKLAIDSSSTIEDRTIDITTTGRRTGEPRRIEIVFYRNGDDIFLSGIPAPKQRDWLSNLQANPDFTFHLKHGVVADLPAVATVVTEPRGTPAGSDCLRGGVQPPKRPGQSVANSGTR